MSFRLHKYWAASLLVYVVGFPLFVCLYLIVETIFGIALPSWILAFMSIGCIWISAGIKIFAWKNRSTVYYEKDDISVSDRIFFYSIPIELFSSLVAIFIIFA